MQNVVWENNLGKMYQIWRFICCPPAVPGYKSWQYHTVLNNNAYKYDIYRAHVKAECLANRYDGVHMWKPSALQTDISFTCKNRVRRSVFQYFVASFSFVFASSSCGEKDKNVEHAQKNERELLYARSLFFRDRLAHRRLTPTSPSLDITRPTTCFK